MCERTAARYSSCSAMCCLRLSAGGAVCSLQPERFQGRINHSSVGDGVGIEISLESEIGNYGARFFSCKDRQSVSGVVVEGRRTIPPGVHYADLPCLMANTRSFVGSSTVVSENPCVR